MNITVKGKQLDLGEALRGHIETALTSVVTKYFGGLLDSNVVLTREAHLFKADVQVHVGRGLTAQGEATDADAYAAADLAIAHVAKRLRRYKNRLRDHHKNGARADTALAQTYILAPTTNDDDHVDPAAAAANPHNPVIVAEMTTEIATLTVGDAVMRLDLGGQPVLLFRHAGHGGINVVYRRADGNVGWIDPAGNESAALGRSAGSNTAH